MGPIAFSEIRQEPLDEGLFKDISGDLEHQGYFIRPAALPHIVRECLLHYQQNLSAAKFHTAAVGRGHDQAKNQFVRQDKIHWLNQDSSNLAVWHQWTEGLKAYLNRHLYLGLFSFESHLAHYQPGAFYKRHYDAFKGESNRIVSIVTYLNEGWLPDQGGELLIYCPHDDTELLRVTPELGTLVIFLSEEFPHEVLTSSRERVSVAGWFRINGTNSQVLDPPN